MNNLPVDVMQARPVGRIVAVSVAAPGRVRTVDYAELPSPWAVLRRRLLPVGPRVRAPGLVATMMKASDIGTAARMRELSEQADLLLQPPVAAFGLTDVRAFGKIVQTGYEYTQERLADWLGQSGDSDPNCSDSDS
jgi:NTE family protein